MRMSEEELRLYMTRTAGHKAPSKYHAKPTQVGEQRFDSSKEASRYQELELMQRSGIIRLLRRQVPLELHCPGGQVVCKYICDFVYINEKGEEVWEDTKSAVTQKLPMYRLKKKWAKLEHGIEILET